MAAMEVGALPRRSLKRSHLTARTACRFEQRDFGVASRQPNDGGKATHTRSDDGDMRFFLSHFAIVDSQAMSVQYCLQIIVSGNYDTGRCICR